MDNNTIRINSYLQNEMNDEERKSFEAELLINNDLRQETEMQKHITSAAFNAGVKNEFAKAMQRKVFSGRIIRFGLSAVAAVAVIMLILFRQHIFSDTKQTIHPGTESLAAAFINPPLPGINVPVSEFSFNAEDGDTLIAPSGSIICFPASSMLDANGKIVKGKVTVKYREFSDPADFFVAGIPMDYDSSGSKYHFESAGMCEINAYQHEQKLFVNPAAQPQVNLSGGNKNPGFNLYYLDTTKRTWVFNGKDLITEVAALKPSAKQSPAVAAVTSVEQGLPVKPVMPRKASDAKQSFSIAIDPGSFKELMAYDKLKFEVTDDTKIKQSDADEHWDNVSLDRTSTEGIYYVTFSTPARKITYTVRPVLGGADYDAALKTFQEKSKAYEAALRMRQGEEKFPSDSLNMVNQKRMEKLRADEAENNRINTLIIARNKSFRENRVANKIFQDSMDKVNAKRILAMTDSGDEWVRRQPEQQMKAFAKEAKDNVVQQEIIRSFQINRFGIWNCDRPLSSENDVLLFANFTDESKSSLPFTGVSVVYKNLNGIINYGMTAGSGQIRVVPGKETMIWAVLENHFYYYSYQDFVQSAISASIGKFTFKMRKAEQPIYSYNDIKKLVNEM